MSEERIIRSFEDLDCWKVAREVREFVRQIVGGVAERGKISTWGSIDEGVAIHHRKYCRGLWQIPLPRFLQVFQ